MERLSGCYEFVEILKNNRTIIIKPRRVQSSARFNNLKNMTKFHINYTTTTPDFIAGEVKLNDHVVINFNATSKVESFNLLNHNGRSILRTEWDQVTNYLKNVFHNHFRGDYLWVD